MSEISNASDIVDNTKQFLETLSVPELKNVCKMQKVGIWGNKKMMIDRLSKKGNTEEIKKFVTETRIQNKMERKRKENEKKTKKNFGSKNLVNKDII